MKREIRRELNRITLVMEEKDFPEDYRIKMLTENKIPGLLKCTVSYVDDMTGLVYELSGRETVYDYIRKQGISESFVKLFITSVILCQEHCREYLLDFNNVLLDLDSIFIEEEEIFFCCCPFCTRDNHECVREILKEFMARTDPDDDRTAEFIRALLLNVADTYSLREVARSCSECHEDTGLYTEPDPAEIKQLKSLEKTRQRMDMEEELGIGYEYRNIILKTPDGEEAFSCTRGQFIIGSARCNVDGYINSPFVSHVHCCIQQKGRSFVIKDLNSERGTYLNGHRLRSGRRTTLHTGDRLEIGDREYIVDIYRG